MPAFIADYDKHFDKFNPAFTVEYDLNNFSRVYGKVVSAYKSGGTSQRSTSEENFKKGFSEEDLVSYEVGYKGGLADGRVRFNAAVFYMTYDDYQQSVQTGRSPGERDFINIKDADIGGRFSVRLWGKNLLDEEYYIGNIRQEAFDTLGLVGGLATFGDPRTYGLTLEYQYD